MWNDESSTWGNNTAVGTNGAIGSANSFLSGYKHNSFKYWNTAVLSTPQVQMEIMQSKHFIAVGDGKLYLMTVLSGSNKPTKGQQSNTSF